MSKKKFENMTKAEKRVAIVKDVLKPRGGLLRKQSR